MDHDSHSNADRGMGLKHPEFRVDLILIEKRDPLVATQIRGQRRDQIRAVEVLRAVQPEVDAVLEEVMEEFSVNAAWSSRRRRGA